MKPPKKIEFIYCHPEHLVCWRSAGKTITKPFLTLNNIVYAYTVGKSKGWFAGVPALKAEVERICGCKLQHNQFKNMLDCAFEVELFDECPGNEGSCNKIIHNLAPLDDGIRIPLPVFMWAELSGSAVLVFGHLLRLPPMAKNPSKSEALPWSTKMIAEALSLKLAAVNRAVIELCLTILVLDEGALWHPKLKVNPNWFGVATVKGGRKDAWKLNEERSADWKEQQAEKDLSGRWQNDKKRLANDKKRLANDKKRLANDKKRLANPSQTLDGPGVSVPYFKDSLDGGNTPPSPAGNFHDQEHPPDGGNGVPVDKIPSAHWDPRKLKTLLLMHPALAEKALGSLEQVNGTVRTSKRYRWDKSTVSLEQVKSSRTSNTKPSGGHKEVKEEKEGKDTPSPAEDSSRDVDKIPSAHGTDPADVPLKRFVEQHLSMVKEYLADTLLEVLDQFDLPIVSAKFERSFEEEDWSPAAEKMLAFFWHRIRPHVRNPDPQVFFGVEQDTNYDSFLKTQVSEKMHPGWFLHRMDHHMDLFVENLVERRLLPAEALRKPRKSKKRNP